VSGEKVTARPDGTLRGGFLKEIHDNGDITADFPPLGEIRVSNWEYSSDLDENDGDLE